LAPTDVFAQANLVKLALLFVLLLNGELRLRFLRALLDYLEFPLFNLRFDNFFLVEHDSEEVLLLQDLL
jgi:hypothetical protein